MFTREEKTLLLQAIGDYIFLETKNYQNYSLPSLVEYQKQKLADLRRLEAKIMEMPIE